MDIWSDVVCPWCYIGKARFERALAGFGHRDQVEVVYRSFELDPGRPDGDAVPVLDMLAGKYGLSAAEVADAEGRIAGLAQAEGLGFRTDRTLGNTFGIHRVLHLGRASDVQPGLLDAIYRAYFAEARPIFDADVLADVAAGAGLDPADVRKTLSGDDYAVDVRQDERQARELGINGVPFFLFDGRLAVSGAQQTATFAEALHQALPA